MRTVLLLSIILTSITKLDQVPMAPRQRYKNETIEKSNGVIYTPRLMARAVAAEMISAHTSEISGAISVLDPAVGEGELLLNFIALLREMNLNVKIRVVGYDIDSRACSLASDNLRKYTDNVDIDIRNGDFLKCLDNLGEKFDFVIANPPYIRTQILGADKAKSLSTKFGLSGRIDFYYYFLISASRALKDDGVAGYITSNKFLSIKSGVPVRRYMLENYRIYSLKDYGDSKVFENAAVLPCTIVFGKGKTEKFKEVKYTTIYETECDANAKACNNIFEHLEDCGKFMLPDGRVFEFKQGSLKPCQPGDVWTFSSLETEEWLKIVNANTWLHFHDLGKVKVGIKTTADNVFIGDKWGDASHPIELLRPLMTHRDAGKVVSRTNCQWKVLYPHAERDGKRYAVDLEDFPNSKLYLEKHRAQLEGRKYVKDAGRAWYEIWVPQNPAAWMHRKIVFRYISKTPQFWFDNTGAIVNGDCYWIDIDSKIPDEMIYLALAIANSAFIEKYYDVRFNTKLYSGKRRFMAQYVEQFPLPMTNSVPSQAAIAIIRRVVESGRAASDEDLDKINSLVEQMFYRN